MKFSALNPLLGSSTRFTTARPIWQLSFECPGCGHRTGVDVTNQDPAGHVWKLSPDPLRLFDGVKSSADVLAQHANAWDGVTIKPSMKDLPHARQVQCSAHFTITNGEITFH